MLKLSILKAPRFRGKVTVNVPMEDGSSLDQSFVGIFQVLDADAVEAHDLTVTEGVKGFLDEALVNTDDVVDDDGEAMPFTPELKAQLLRSPLTRLPLLLAYNAGLAEARRGN